MVENIPLLEEPVPGWELAVRLRTSLSRWKLSPVSARITVVSRNGGLFLSEAAGIGVQSRTVILATGTVPVEYTLPGDHPPILRSFMDLPEKMQGLRLAVLGGGEAAFDYAMHASDLGAEVEIILRGAHARASGRLLEEASAHPGIRISYDTVPVAARTSGEGMILELDSPSGRVSLEVAAVLAAVGRERTLPLLPERFTQLFPRSVETTLPGLYLAGDAALGGLGQAGSAMGQGLTAAEKAFGFVMKGTPRV